jgi:hypothetical protein
MRRTMILSTMFILAASVFGQGQSAVIVKQIVLTNQTAYIPPTVLVTPTSDALYRITAYLEVLSKVGPLRGDFYYLNIGWTDASPAGGAKKTIAVSDYTAPLRNQMAVIASDIVGKPLMYSVTDGFSMPPQAPFNVYITVEQLQ